MSAFEGFVPLTDDARNGNGQLVGNPTTGDIARAKWTGEVWAYDLPPGALTEQLDFEPTLWIVRRPRKLNAEAVRDIVHRLERGEPQASIARHHGVDPRTIRDIKTGKSWKCITELEPA